MASPMKNLKHLLDESLNLIKINEGNPENFYKIIYKDGTGILFNEGDINPNNVNKVIISNIAYISVKNSWGFCDSIKGELLKENEQLIQNHLEKYDLKYFRIFDGNKIFDLINFKEVK